MPKKPSGEIFFILTTRISTDKCLAWSLCHSRATCSYWLPKGLADIQLVKLYLWVSFTDCLDPRLSKVGGPEIGVAHRSHKVGGPRPTWPSSFRRLWLHLSKAPLSSSQYGNGLTVKQALSWAFSTKT